MANLRLIILMTAMLKICDSLEIIVVQLRNDNNSLASPWLDFSESDLLQNFNDLADLHNCSYSAVVSCILQYPNSLVLLDLSKDLAIQQSLSSICEEHSLFHLVYQKTSKYFEKSTYSFAISVSKEIEAFSSLLSYFNWSQGAFFIDQENYALKDEISNFSDEFEYFTIASLTDIDDLVSRSVIRAGITIYYFLLENHKSQELQKSFVKAKLLMSGSGIVLNQESGYQCEIDGALIISEKGHEYDNSSKEYVKSSIESIISLLLYAQNSEEIKRLLDLEMKNRIQSPEFSIINIQNGKRVIVGSIINREVSISHNLVFLGQSSIVPKSSKKPCLSA